MGGTLATKKPKIPRQILRVHLLKAKGPFAKETDTDKVLDLHDGEHVDRKEVHIGSGGNRLDAVLFIGRREPKSPKWQTFLEDGFGPLDKYLSRNTANAAVLIAKVGANFFALTFGYGRSMLLQSALVRGFGIRAALALIDPESISSLDSRSVDVTTFFKNMQSNRRVSLYDFGLDTETEMLRGVYGYPDAENDLCSKVLGSEALLINPRTNFAGLRSVLRQCYAAYSSKKYRNRYEFIDNIQAVSDPSIRDELDKSLVLAVRTSSATVSLGQPVPVDQSVTAGFRLSRGKKGDPTLAEVGLQTYLSKFRDPSKIDIETLKKDRVVQIGLDQVTTLARWPVYRWLIYEVALNGESYVLQDGDYYVVAPDFRAKVDADVRRIKQSNLDYPKWTSSSHKDEAAYNRALQKKNAPSTLLDKKLVTGLGGHSSMELCDVLHYEEDQLHFVHVKKYGGSSVLSHLFSQGLVATEAILDDEAVRRKLRTWLPNARKPRIPITGVEPTKMTIVFAMAFENRGRKAVVKLLPFFSKLNLRSRASELRKRGVKCELATFEYEP